MIEIDGEFGEGGGQVLRNCTSLAALLKKPIHITKIRANRSTPGLRPQHMTGIQFVNRLSNGTLEGDRVNSSQITFCPGDIRGGDFVVDCGTAGSTCLLTQISLPCIVFAPTPSSVRFIGGTNVSHSPPFEEMKEVFQPIARNFGFDFDFEIIKRGFYPRGGGEVLLRVASPVRSISPIQMMDQGVVTVVRCIVFCCGLPQIIGDRMAQKAKKEITSFFRGTRVGFDYQVRTDPYMSVGCGLTLVAETSTGCVFGGSAMGEKKVPAEDVAEEAVLKLIKQINEGGCVDEWTQDQVLIFMALAKGISRIRTGPLTLHTETSIHFAQVMTGAKFTVGPSSDNPKTFTIECEGVGYESLFAPSQ